MGAPQTTATCAMAEQLADTLHPLPVAALGVLLRSRFAAADDDLAATVVDLTGHGFVGFSIADVRSVLFKIEALHPTWLPCSFPTALRSPSPTCGDCGAEMEHGIQVSCHILTFAAGLRPFSFHPFCCPDCNRCYAGGWGWAAGQPNAAQLQSRVEPGAVRFLSLAPKAASVVAMDDAMYRFITASLVHVRSSFSGFSAVLEMFHGFPHVEHLHHRLLHGWIVYQAIQFLQDTHWESLREIRFSFGRHQPGHWACLSSLLAPMQELFLRRYAQEHRCVACIAMPALAIDGKVNRAVPVCHVRAGTPVHMLRGDVVLDFGCLRGRQFGSLACSLHHTPAAVATTSVLCLEGHRLHRCDRPRFIGRSCDLCAEAFSSGVVWRCGVGCEWRICHACATTPPAANTACDPVPGTHLPHAPDASLPSTIVHVSGEAASMEEEGNPCGVEKQPPSNTGPRFYGGMIAASVACGRVAMIQAIAGHESLTQVFGVLAAVGSRRSLEFVVYDNACALARFVRRLARRSPSGVRTQCAGLTFCIDRFHAQNHTACRNPRHRLFMPEVDIGQYPVLQEFNSSVSEQFNSWLELFLPLMRPMRPETFDCFVLLLAILWNEVIIPSRVTCPAAGFPRQELLKRRRRG